MSKYTNYFIVSQNAAGTEVAIAFKQVSPSHICSVGNDGKINITTASEIVDVASVVMNRKDAEELYESLKNTLGK